MLFLIVGLWFYQNRLEGLASLPMAGSTIGDTTSIPTIPVPTPNITIGKNMAQAYPNLISNFTDNLNNPPALKGWMNFFFSQYINILVSEFNIYNHE